MSKGKAESNAMDDIYNAAANTELPGAGRYAGGTRVIAGEKRIGRVRAPFDSRIFGYDVLEGRSSKAMGWHLSKDDVMDASEARAKLTQIHRSFGIDREPAVVLYHFDKAMFFCHTLNSGSTLQPGRAYFQVDQTQFDFRTVVDILGVDLRRFFRVYADEIRAVNQEVISTYDPGDILSAEKYKWLRQVAEDRGLSRYPDLAHDTSDKCSLTATERMAVSASKQSVFGSVVNSADRMNANSRMITSDNWDSTTRAVVPNMRTERIAN